MVEVTACPICAADVGREVGRRGRRRIFCSAACNRRSSELRASARKQAARQAAVLPCETCAGVVVVGVRGPVPRFCSEFCRLVADGSVLAEPYPSRTCALAECGEQFVPKIKTQMCCSEDHGRARWKAANPRPKDALTPARQANLRRKTQLRRALLRDPEAASIDRDDIGVRDGWRCGLCLKAVDNTLAYPHPLSPSLDHIEPLSLGGKHTPSNVQISHLTCNVAKGNRARDVQPLLIG